MSRVQPAGRVHGHRDLRRSLEGFERLDLVSDEMRNLDEESFCELLGKLPPRKPRTPSISRRRGGATWAGNPAAAMARACGLPVGGASPVSLPIWPPRGARRAECGALRVGHCCV